MEYDYGYFKKQVYDITGIELGAYKESQMKRRIDTLIQRSKIDGYEKFVAQLRCDPKLLQTFINYLTINVSECYRNPEQWGVLEKEVFPNLISRFGQGFHVWSAACSTGEEPYSLVMSLSQFIPLDKIHILATDIDDKVIEKAKIGIYTSKSVASVPEKLRKTFFNKVGDEYYISDEVKSRVEFKQHNLLSDSYPSNMNLIVCRNVLIYFTESAKESVFEKFSKSLTTGGFLFLGSTEQMLGRQKNEFERMGSFFFCKK